MNFNSFSFLLFLILVLLVYQRLGRHKAARQWFFLSASFFFYCSWNVYFGILILLTILVDYSCAKAIYFVHTRPEKKYFLRISLIYNISIIMFFKYSGFFAGNVDNLFSLLGLDWTLGFSAPLLPVGISFFTFQSLSYTIDVYFGKMRPVQKWRHYALYVSFFPQLVAGPIVRAKDFLPQLFNSGHFLYRRFRDGLFLVLAGLIKKALLADFLARSLVDNYFSSPYLYSRPEALLAMLAYGFQIYLDFSAYSDIAIGVAKMLGFRLPKNFARPYKSRSPREFWRRWHISLSTWFRDYLYIPLGGSHKGKSRTAMNLLVTMLIAGLWHGAGWNFLLWGLLHGLALALQHFLFPGKVLQSHWPLFLRVLVNNFCRLMTFVWVFLLWTLFRTRDLTHLQAVWKPVFKDVNSLNNITAAFVLALSLSLVLHFSPDRWQRNLRARFHRLHPFNLALFASLVLILVLLALKAGSQAFIYFQF